MSLYSIAIRYRREGGKLRWFMGTQEAPNRPAAEQAARAAFAAECPGLSPVAVFIERASADQEADYLLSALAGVSRDERAGFLALRGVKVLRAAADLCGQDSAHMSKRAAIAAILANF